MILFLLLAEDHEQDGGDADDDAGEDVNGWAIPSNASIGMGLNSILISRAY